MNDPGRVRRADRLPRAPGAWSAPGALRRLRVLVSRSGRPSPVARFEQAVYGSFSFRDQGYGLLAWSPGCRDGWLAEFRAACQNLGERPAGVPEAPGVFALRLAGGPWAVVGVFPQGSDDRGRPGALAFHGLFLAPREYRKAGCDPFALVGALRDDWSAATPQALPAGSWGVEPPREAAGADPLAPEVARALTAGHRVALEAAGPIDELARQVWRLLPVRVRARASVATWAFGNANRFDLLGVPRLWGVPLDASYVAPGAGGGDAGRAPRPRTEGRSRGPWVAAGLAAVVGGAGVVLALRGGRKGESPAPTADAVSRPAPVPVPVPRSPSPAGGGEEVGPDERRRVAEALTALAERFGVGAGGEASRDPSALMERVARGLRYRGPFLSDAERGDLGREPGRDAALVLRWDALARRFADDRPLPRGFRRGPLRWQIGVLAWSFHAEREAGVDPSAPRRSAAEAAQALAESLAVDVPLRPTPLSARYPAVASYLAFLGRLPRR